MHYHPSMHAAGPDSSRPDQMDMPMGASSMPTGQAHPVAMAANFIPAAIPPLYRDYTNVDSINPQVSIEICDLCIRGKCYRASLVKLSLECGSSVGFLWSFSAPLIG